MFVRRLFFGWRDGYQAAPQTEPPERIAVTIGEVETRQLFNFQGAGFLVFKIIPKRSIIQT